MASVPTITYCSDFIVSYTVAVDCGNLANPTNGEVDLTGTIVDSTATYSCDDGFTLQGQSTRTCQDDGQWSGSAPTCERKLDVAFMQSLGRLCGTTCALHWWYLD